VQHVRPTLPRRLSRLPSAIQWKCSCAAEVAFVVVEVDVLEAAAAAVLVATAAALVGVALGLTAAALATVRAAGLEAASLEHSPLWALDRSVPSRAVAPAVRAGAGVC
jgi:tetrahydromethanopterin S-methyltransferase subunit E